MKYAIIASTFSGNKGAASMLEASIQTITAEDKKAEFAVFTVYPEQDAAMNSYNNVTVYGAKPLYLGLVLNPLALLHKALFPLRGLLRRHERLRVIHEADVFLDQGGITFVDGRAKFLIYNVATILPAMLVGTPVVKCAQAMGPFKTKINQFVAGLFLPKVRTICARGAITKEHLDELDLDNVIESTDFAFLMEMNAPEKHAAKKVYDKAIKGTSGHTVVGVMPSEVVRKKVTQTGRDYAQYNVEFIEHLLGEGYIVVLLAYSARANTDSLHNNDLPICRQIAANISHENFAFIDEELSAQQLRYIIELLDLVVVSRFHAMVAALSVGTPPLVIGWSHKYKEIMSLFDIEDLALDSSKLDQDLLQKAFKDLAKNKTKLEKKIKKSLPDVKKSAHVQVEEVGMIVNV